MIPIYEIPPAESTNARAHRIWRRYVMQRQARRIRHLLAGTVGAAASLLIHSLIIGSALWGGAALQTRRPLVQGLGGTATDSAGETVMTLILLNDTQPTKGPPEPQELPSRGLTTADLEVRVLSPDPYPAIDLTHVGDSASVLSPEAHDAAERALLFGRYIGQINARIERAWLRPRTPIGDALFQCQVAINQDQRGNVQDVTLQDCNGDARWQQSLVNAIQSASPLPAPPNPEVFSSAVTLRFESAAYVTGETTEGFEPGLRMASADIASSAKLIAIQSSPMFSSTRREGSR